ncbi:MAG: hypothetical protein AB1816_17150, partial [Bacillota bacterium]
MRQARGFAPRQAEQGAVQVTGFDALGLHDHFGGGMVEDQGHQVLRTPLGQFCPRTRCQAQHSPGRLRPEDDPDPGFVPAGHTHRRS